jgi:membrane-bound lytic murein transglycosylase B
MESSMLFSAAVLVFAPDKTRARQGVLLRMSPTKLCRSLLSALIAALWLAAAVGVGAVTPEQGNTQTPTPSAVPELPLPPASFETWRDAFKARAQALGIAPATLETAFAGVGPLAQVVALDRRQSEYSRTFFDYLKNSISETRINRGQALLKEHAQLLADIQGRHGTPPALLVALWGLETDYGTQTGGFPVIAALATLAYEGRRRDFFTNELIEALRIVDSGQAGAATMTGSWAGAMGQPQFMPSTYRRYARDGDGDGRADIWNSVADTLESAANYLSANGWKPNEGWGREVLLPTGFDFSQARLGKTKSLEEWGRLGVRDASGGPLPGGETTASMVLPAGAKGPAFLVYPNFNVINTWNRSLFYGLSVGHLSDWLNGGGPLYGEPPAGDKALPRTRIIAMQRGLNRLGFPLGEPDGMIGAKTRNAVQDYQQSRGLPADAYPTSALIDRIEQEASRLDQ